MSGWGTLLHEQVPEKMKWKGNANRKYTAKASTQHCAVRMKWWIVGPENLFGELKHPSR